MDAPANTTRQRTLNFTELVAIIASVMALNALAIDMMLPALGLIAEDLDIVDGNDRQRIIVFYVLANGFGQIIFGPLVDRFGRRPVLMWALSGYMAGSLLSVFAGSFTLLLAARGFQGVATAATRVAAIAVVRDQCEGRKMAQAMSLGITIFMAAPILAPGFGQLILFAGPWRTIFFALFLYGLVLAVWLGWRLPETLDQADRKPLQPRAIANAYMIFIRNRTSIGYTLASTFCFGALFGYIGASEQIFLELFDVGPAFAVYFALIAGALGAATLFNARLVETVGMRRLAHGAILALIIISLLHLVLASTMGETLTTFMVFMMPSFFCLGLIGPNASALAMQPMGHNAGAAAAANGFAGTTGAGFLGGLIGSFYNGSTTPILLGFAILAMLAFCTVLWTEKGELFHPGEREGEAV
ncbi:MAG: multidrug effflux MFS transporter [Pseudomonadota bacterium]